MYARQRIHQGFTLIEILIVVVILGILAAIVIPQFTSASQQAQASSLASQLQTIRSQIELYQVQHGGDYPTSDGSPTGTFEWDKLTTATNASGDLASGSGSSGSFPYGPYLEEPPKNGLAPDGSQTSTDNAWSWKGDTRTFVAVIQNTPETVDAVQGAGLEEYTSSDGTGDYELGSSG